MPAPPPMRPPLRLASPRLPCFVVASPRFVTDTEWFRKTVTPHATPHATPRASSTLTLREETERVFKLADVSDDGKPNPDPNPDPDSNPNPNPDPNPNQVTNDGKLDLDELGKMTGFAKLAKRLMGKADVDSSGQLTMEEWVTYIESKGDQATKVLQLYENALTKDADATALANDAGASTGRRNERSQAGGPPSTPRPPPSPRAAAAAAADAAAAAAVIQNAATPPPPQPRVLIMPEALRGEGHTDEHFPMPAEATGGGAVGGAAGGAAGGTAGGEACGGRAAVQGDGSAVARPGRTPRGVLSTSARGDVRGGNSRGSTSSSVRPSPSTISLEQFEQRAVLSTSRGGPAAGLSLTKVYFSRK